jgi:hypothetical protein
MTYIAITLHYWGKSLTQAGALRNMRDAGGRTNEKSHGYVIVETDDPHVVIDPIHGGVEVHEGKTATMVVDKRTKKGRP